MPYLDRFNGESEWRSAEETVWREVRSGEGRQAVGGGGRYSGARESPSLEAEEQTEGVTVTRGTGWELKTKECSLQHVFPSVLIDKVEHELYSHQSLVIARYHPPPHKVFKC